MIVDVGRGHIQIKCGDRTATIAGEAYLRGHGSPDFVIYGNSLQRWDPPFDGELIEELQRMQILKDTVKELFDERGMTAEIE